MAGSGVFNLDVSGVLLVLLTALVILISRNWRVTLGALYLQYCGVFILVYALWPLPLALIKLTAGWFATTALGVAFMSLPLETHPTPPSTAKIVLINRIFYLPPLSRGLFRLLAALLVLLVVFSIATRVADWVPGIAEVHTLGAFILIGLGLLHLGFTAWPFRTIVSLLTVLAGFEVLYAAVETSTLVAGLLAIMNLGLALVGTILISPQAPEVEG